MHFFYLIRVPKTEKLSLDGTVINTYDWLGSKLKSIISNKTYEFDYNAHGLRERKLVKVSTETEQEIYYFYDLNDRLIA